MLLLRIPAALSGAVAVFVAWYLFRKTVGEWQGLAIALLIATLPVAISYSRISWDPSQTVLATLLCVYFALQCRPKLTLLFFVCALLVHPTNIFILPFLLSPFAVRLFRHQRQLDKALRKALLIKVSMGLGGVIIVAVAIYLVLDLYQGSTPTQLIKEKIQLATVSGLTTFFYSVGNLLNGVTIYSYFIGWMLAPMMLIHVGLFWAVLALLLALNISKKSVTLAYAAGFLISLLLFYLIGGTQNVQPHLERYALWIVAPAVVLCVLLSANLLGDKRTFGAVLIVSVLLLCSFSLHYFLPTWTTNCLGHRTFLTGDREPKRVAAAIIRDDASEATDKRNVVYAQDWWIYWPIKYLLAKEAHVEVTIYGRPWDWRFPRDFVLRAPDSKTRRYYVGFHNSPYMKHLDAVIHVDKRQVIVGYPNDQPLLSVYSAGN
jgi:hypothetical protein